MAFKHQQTLNSSIQYPLAVSFNPFANLAAHHMHFVRPCLLPVGYGNRDHPFGRHLLPGATITVKDCDCDEEGNSAANAVVVGAGIAIFLIAFGASGGAAGLVGAVTAAGM